jgi:hypothetical protein
LEVTKLRLCSTWLTSKECHVGKSTFNQRLHRLDSPLSILFYYLADFFKALNLSGQYLIDSFPVAVCNNIRIGRSRLVEGGVYRGKIALKGRSFFGFRVQLITTLSKQPVQFFILPGSYVDVTALQMLHLDLPAGSEVFADADYTNYDRGAGARESILRRV